MLRFFLILPQGVLPFLLRIFLFPVPNLSFCFGLLMLEFEDLLCFRSNALILQLTADFTLHPFRIDLPFLYPICFHRQTEFQGTPVLQQKIIYFIIFGSAPNVILQTSYLPLSKRSYRPTQNGFSNRTVKRHLVMIWFTFLKLALKRVDPFQKSLIKKSLLFKNSSSDEGDPCIFRSISLVGLSRSNNAASQTPDQLHGFFLIHFVKICNDNIEVKQQGTGCAA